MNQQHAKGTRQLRPWTDLDDGSISDGSSLEKDDTPAAAVRPAKVLTTRIFVPGTGHSSNCSATQSHLEIFDDRLRKISNLGDPCSIGGCNEMVNFECFQRGQTRMHLYVPFHNHAAVANVRMVHSSA